MPSKDALCNKWIANINLDEIESIIDEIQDKLEDCITAVKLLVSLNQLAHNSISCNRNNKSSYNVIYELCDKCCKIIISKWLSSIEKIRIYKCLYHLMNYFFHKDQMEYIIKICNYICEISEKPNENHSKEDKSLLQHIVILLLVNTEKKLNLFNGCIIGNNETTLLNIYKLTFRINAICDHFHSDKYLCSLIQTSIFLNSQGHKDIQVFQKECLELITPETVPNIDKLLRFLYLVLINWTQSNTVIESQFLLNYSHIFAKSSDKNKYFFKMFSNIVCFFEYKYDEINFLQIVNMCNFIIEKWCFEEDKLCIMKVLSCNRLIFLLFKFRKEWIKHVSTFNIKLSVFQPLFLLLKNIYHILKLQTYESCVLPSGEKCELRVDAVSLIKCQFLILALISILGKIDETFFIKSYTEALSSLQICLEWLNRMKYLNCPGLEYSCAFIFPASVNMSYLVISHTDDLHFVSSTLKCMISLPRKIIHMDQYFTMASCLISCLSHKLVENGKLDESLLVITAALFVWPNCAKSLFAIWSDLKHNYIAAGHEDHLELTIFDVVLQKKEELKKDWEILTIPSNGEIVNFLIMEMESYFENRLLRDKPILTAFSVLRKLTGDVFVCGKVLIMAMEVSTSSNKYSSDLAKHLELSEKMLILLKKQLIRKKGSKEAVELEFLIGNILYQQFRSEIRKVRNKSETEMALPAFVESVKPSISIQDVNPNDKCDVNPNIANLSVEAQLTTLIKLDQAFQQWQVAFSKATEPLDIMKITLENLWNTGLLYRLYCMEDEEIKTWTFLYSVAKKFNYIEKKVIAVSELLSMNSNIDSSWVSECLEDISNSKDVLPRIKFVFQINLVQHKLIENKIDDVSSILQSFYLDWKKYNLTKILFQFKLNNFESILSKNNLIHYPISDVIHLQNSLKMCLSYAQSNIVPRHFTELTQIHYIGLKASQDLGELYWYMKAPRNARLYLKSHINIAQKLSVPLRSAQLLSLLTWLDLDCGKLPEACEKLDNLEAILGVQNTENLFTQTNSDNSPILSSPQIKLPKFLEHEKTCSCFYCKNTEYKRLVLESLVLRAEYSVLIGDKNNAIIYFKAGIQVLEEIWNKKEVNRALSTSGARLWLKYSKYQCLLKNFSEAIKANQVAENFCTSEDFFTHSKIVFQFSNLQSELNTKTKKQISDKNKQKIIKHLKTPNKVERWNFKTPPVPYSILSTKNATSPLTNIKGKKTPLQPIKFHLYNSSDDEENEKENKTISQKMYKYKTPPKLVITSPLTLMPSKKKDKKGFNVFSDESDNLFSKKTSMRSETKIQTSSKTSDLNTNSVKKAKIKNVSLESKPKITKPSQIPSRRNLRSAAKTGSEFNFSDLKSALKDVNSSKPSAEPHSK